MSNENKKEELGFVVVAVRHFSNGEHHWFAPDAKEVEDWIEAEAFTEEGKVRRNEYYKPVFTSMADAERYAMSKRHGEWTLAQWEEKRPTFYLLEESAFVSIVEKDDYSLPKGAESWSDAKAADFERECDCEDIEFLSLWDSESDEERINEKTAKVIDEINKGMEGVDAWYDDGYVLLHYSKGQNKEACADFIEGMEGFPRGKLEWVKSEEADGVAYYRVK